MAEEKAEKPVPPAGQETKTAEPAKPEGAGKEKKAKFSFSSLSSKEKLVVKLAGFFMVALLVDLIMVRPVGSYLGRIDEQIEAQKKILPKKLLILNYKDQILKEYEESKEFMTDESLSQEEEIAQLLREIESISKKSNLFVQNINPVERTDIAADIYELTVDIEGSAAMEQIIGFMQELETENPALRVKNLTLAPKSKDAQELKFSFTILKLGVREKGMAVSPSKENSDESSQKPAAG